MPAADFNRGVARGRAAAFRRQPRMAALMATALTSLSRRCAQQMRTQTAAAWTGPEPAQLTDALRRRFEARWLADDVAGVEEVKVEAMRSALGPMFAAVGVSLDLANPLLRDALRTVGNRTDLAETAWDGIRSSLQASYDEGESIPNAARRMVRETAAVADRRARVIARTELAQVVNLASVTAARATRTAPYKQWLATADSRTRNSHRAAAGQVRALDDTFAVGGYDLDYPGDPAGPAAEVIHCRCTLVYSDDAGGYGGDTGAAALLAGMTAEGCACADGL